MTHVSLENEQINIQHQLPLRFAILLGSLSRKQDNGKTGVDIEFESLCSIDKNIRLNSGEFVTARLPQNHQKIDIPMFSQVWLSVSRCGVIHGALAAP